MTVSLLLQCIFNAFIFCYLIASEANCLMINTPFLAITTSRLEETVAYMLNRGGVLEDVLGLEDTFSSPWPWPRSLRSSKIALSSARGQHYILTVEILLENTRNLAENLRTPFLFFEIGA